MQYLARPLGAVRAVMSDSSDLVLDAGCDEIGTQRLVFDGYVLKPNGPERTPT
jgi:hypothetical protein